MREPTTDPPRRPADVRDERAAARATADHPDVLAADVLWVPPEQAPKRGVFAVHAGDLVLLATCDDCGETTRTTAYEHLFVACAHCPGEITLAWDTAPDAHASPERAPSHEASASPPLHSEASRTRAIAAELSGAKPRMELGGDRHEDESDRS